MTLSFWYWSPYVTITLQIICIVHLLRTGRSRDWLYLLIFLPFAGSLIYIVKELLPSLRRGHGSKAVSGLFSSSRIKELEKQRRLEMLYARALELNGEADKGQEAYRYVIRMHHTMKARYRYGLMLQAMGRHSEARAQFQAILDDREHQPARIRQSSRPWMRGTKAGLRA